MSADEKGGKATPRSSGIGGFLRNLTPSRNRPSVTEGKNEGRRVREPVQILKSAHECNNFSSSPEIFEECNNFSSTEECLTPFFFCV